MKIKFLKKTENLKVINEIKNDVKANNCKEYTEIDSLWNEEIFRKVYLEDTNTKNYSSQIIKKYSTMYEGLTTFLKNYQNRILFIHYSLVIFCILPI